MYAFARHNKASKENGFIIVALTKTVKPTPISLTHNIQRLPSLSSMPTAATGDPFGHTCSDAPNFDLERIQIPVRWKSAESPGSSIRPDRGFGLLVPPG